MAAAGRGTAAATPPQSLTSSLISAARLARAAAVHASRSGTTEAVQGIIGTLVDPLPAVRRAGAAALGELRGHEAIPALTQAMTRTTDRQALFHLAEALSAVVDRLEPREAARVPPPHVLPADAGRAIYRCVR